MQMMGKTNFEVHILKDKVRMANYLPKMGKDATFAWTLNGHNSVNFHPILTVEINTKMMSSSSKSNGVKSLAPFFFRLGFGFLGLFCSKALHGQHLAHVSKTSHKIHVPGITFNA